MPGTVISSSGTSQNRQRFDADGINNVFTITHNLGTQNLIAQVWDEDTLEAIIVDIDAATVDTVTVTFAVVPTNDKNYIINIIGALQSFT